MFDTGDTIAAVSSPPGAAPRGIVRLTGPGAIRIVSTVFEADGGPPLADQPAWTRIAGQVRLAGSTLPAIAHIFRKPRSYTRADLVEIHLLGAPGVLALLLDDLVAAGARRAGPGEFTARAFIAGGMDLAEAQGVAALIAAQSDAELSAARRLLTGELSVVAAAAREELADLLSLVEGALDFADEPIEFITADQLRTRLRSLQSRLAAALAAGAATERLSHAPRVLLAGKPNAGKSSLLNRLTGLDRAISSPVAGTTRDQIAAPLQLPIGEVLLIDVAGTDHTENRLNRAAQESAAAARRDADLILHILDASRPVDPPTAPGHIFVLNKIDLVDPAESAALAGALRPTPGTEVVAVSARTGAGCEQLCAAMNHALLARRLDAREHQLALSVEHRDALTDASDAVRRAIDLAADDEQARTSAELIAVELRDAADRLGTITGELAPDELLGRIFARFCIGK